MKVPSEIDSLKGGQHPRVDWSRAHVLSIREYGIWAGFIIYFKRDFPDWDGFEL